MNTKDAQLRASLPWRLACVWAAVAIAAFHVAYGVNGLGFVIVFYAFAVYQLSFLPSPRQAFYSGTTVGLLTVAPQLVCFWVIFGASAVALWIVVAVWLGLFVSLTHLCRRRFGPVAAAILAPFLWTGLEYFRSELWYLRFSWMNIGYAFSDYSVVPFVHWLGMYGTGFAAMALASGLSLLPPRRRLFFSLRIGLLAVLVLFLNAYKLFERKPTAGPVRGPLIAGMQLEFPSEAEVLKALDELLLNSPKAELLFLSEYTFTDVAPTKVRNWCREHKRHLLVGGEDPAPGKNFYDTAFVIDPEGEIVFRQVKCVPIQFMKDGLPATEQRLWDSPWGKLGICVCYDLSFTRVTDRLVRLGAEAILVPTMDVVDWGRHQHELHARVAPVRAAEYGIPIIRVASSGVSQHVDRTGLVLSKAGVPGQKEMIEALLVLGGPGKLPLDRWLAPAATALTALVIVALIVTRKRKGPFPQQRDSKEKVEAAKEPALREP